MAHNKQFIHHIDWDTNFGIPIATDMQGNQHILDWDVMTPTPHHRIFLNGYNVTNFPNTNDFFPIPNLITGEPFLRYTVPDGHDFFLGVVHTAQSSDGLSLLGVYVDNVFVASVPFYVEMHFALGEPMIILENTTLEIKIKPHTSNLDVGIMLRGILVDKQAE